MHMDKGGSNIIAYKAAVGQMDIAIRELVSYVIAILRLTIKFFCNLTCANGCYIFGH